MKRYQILLKVILKEYWNIGIKMRNKNKPQRLNKEDIQVGDIYWFLPRIERDDSDSFYFVISIDENLRSKNKNDLKVFSFKDCKIKHENSWAICACYNDQLLDILK